MAAALCGLTEWALDAYGLRHWPRVGRAADTRRVRGGWMALGRSAASSAHGGAHAKANRRMARGSHARAVAGSGVLFVMFVCLLVRLGSASQSGASRAVRAGRCEPGGRNATSSSADGQARTSGTGSGHHGIAFIPIKHSSVDCKVCPCGQTGFTLP